MQQTVTFPSGTVSYLFQSSFDVLWQRYDRQKMIFVTDSRVAALHPHIFEGQRTLVIPQGEASKSMTTIEGLAQQLLGMEATRHTLLVGIGGGVVTDITGLLASVYMRGIAFGFVPTTLLGMVDAAVGGKNGVNIGVHKNIIGTISQPQFLLYDSTFLDTLPAEAWSNGFAEVIKYACIFDGNLFEELSAHDIDHYKRNKQALDHLITKCVAWKNKMVLEDEQEKGVRKLLNFGHTAGHAIENLYGIPHGHAVSIGMVIACTIAEEMTGLDKAITARLRAMLTRYQLPIQHSIDVASVMQVLKMDKKRVNDTIDYVLPERIGKAKLVPLPLSTIEHALTRYESDH